MLLPPGGMVRDPELGIQAPPQKEPRKSFRDQNNRLNSRGPFLGVEARGSKRDTNCEWGSEKGNIAKGLHRAFLAKWARVQGKGERAVASASKGIDKSVTDTCDYPLIQATKLREKDHPT